MREPPSKRRRLGAKNLVWGSLALVGVGAVFFLFLPRKGSIRAFDPDRVARLEADMWKSYYEKRFVALAFELYSGLRENYGVSPWDAALMAADLADAARIFKASTSRKTAGNAIPALERAYRRLLASTDAAFDPARAASLELEWWQQRREHVAPEQYARTIAELSREIYSCPPGELVGEAALERARAMAFRDSHRADISHADWATIAGMLERAYRLFHRAVIGGEGARQSAAAPPDFPGKPDES